MSHHILQTIVNALNTLPKELVTFLVAMLPIVELRGAIPLAMTAFAFPWPKAYLLSVAGNLAPILPILFLYKPIRRLLSILPFMRRFFEWTERKALTKGEKILKYGAIGLTLFVAVPLPVTGAWTGSLVALLFGIKPRWAVPAITLGVLIAGVIVTVSVIGLKALF